MAVIISKKKKKKLFLDLKLNDIPNTSVNALKSLRDLKNIDYITVHANAGEETIRTVVKIIKRLIQELKYCLLLFLPVFPTHLLKNWLYKTHKRIGKKTIFTG